MDTDSLASGFFELEKRKINLDCQKSDTYLAVSSYVICRENEKILKLPNRKFGKIKLQLVPGVSFLKIKKAGGVYQWHLLKQTEEGIKSLPINDFCRQILSSFQGSTRISDQINRLNKYYTKSKDTSSSTLKEKALWQAREALKQGILSEAKA
jgi:hypothetical protein